MLFFIYCVASDPRTWQLKYHGFIILHILSPVDLEFGTAYPGPLAQGLPQTAVRCQPGLCSHVKASPGGEEGCAPQLTLVEPSSFLFFHGPLHRTAHSLTADSRAALDVSQRGCPQCRGHCIL